MSLSREDLSERWGNKLLLAGLPNSGLEIALRGPRRWTLRERGVQVECLPTDRAVVRFGELDPTRTAAALHLTC